MKNNTIRENNVEETKDMNDNLYGESILSGKSSKKKIIKGNILIFIIFIIIALIGLSYTFFNYTRTGDRNELIVGQIYLHYNTSRNLLLSDVEPRNDLDPNMYIEFTVDGLNEYKKKDIWYGIDILYGDVPTGKTETNRIRDDLLRFTLTKQIDENDEITVFENKGYGDIDELRIYVEKIAKETNTETTHNYKLYVWISDEIRVGNTANDDYTMAEWNNLFGSIRVRVVGDFLEKSNTDYIKVNFDANGGEVDTLYKYYNFGDMYGTLPTPVRDGYVFDGWEISGSNLVSSSDIVLSAITVDESVHETIPEGETKTANMYRYNGSYTFTGSNYINTEMYLFSADNFSKNFYISFEITKMNSGSANWAGIVSSHYAKNSKGFIFQRSNNTSSFVLQVNNKVGNQGTHNDYSVPASTSKVEILRLGGRIYYILDGGGVNAVNSFTDTGLAFNVPVYIGANKINTGNPSNYFKGTISNILIEYIDNNATIDNYNNYIGNTAVNTFNGDINLVAKWSVHTMNTLPEFITNKKTEIKRIIFKKENANDLARYNSTASNLKGDIATNGSVKAWLELDNSDNMYTMYVESDGKTFLTTGTNLFNGYTNVVEIDLSNVDTSMVTEMTNMFAGCHALTYLDVSSFDTSNVANMHYMFGHCNSLTSLNVSNFNTASVTSMNNMFQGCSGLTSLNVSNFNTASVTSMSNMFNGCSSLTSLNVSSFVTSSVQNMQGMFNGCSGLTGITFGSNFNTASVTSMSNMFNGCSSLTSLNLGNSFNTGAVNNMGSMFYNCRSLTSLDVSSFNTSNVTNMKGMFYNCSNLTGLDVSKFSTSNVTDMNGMFNYCSSLTSIDVSHFSTGNVTDMANMFEGCSSLIILDLSSFDTSKVTSMYEMFRVCQNLTTIYVSSLWSLSSVTNSQSMFNNCSSLVGTAPNTSYAYNGPADKTYAKIATDTEKGYLTDISLKPSA